MNSISSINYKHEQKACDSLPRILKDNFSNANTLTDETNKKFSKTEKHIFRNKILQEITNITSTKDNFYQSQSIDFFNNII